MFKKITKCKVKIMISEKSIENLIVKAVENKTTEKLGLYPYKEIYQQVYLGPYGTADLIAIERSNDDSRIITKVIVIEVKKGRLGEDTITQAYRYLTGIKEIMEIRTQLGSIFEVHLIGQEISNNSYLLNHSQACKAWILELNYNGSIEFINSNELGMMCTLDDGWCWNLSEDDYSFIEDHPEI